MIDQTNTIRKNSSISLSSLLDSVLVIGGGIAGVRASLDLVEQGHRVYLVEEAPTLGVVTAQLKKTFQTNDCSRCILAPKLIECGRHPNIKLLTYSQVKEVKGQVGNFTVKIERKPRYVKEEKCNGCGLCSQVCPIQVPNEFEQRVITRKAIYIPFPQVIPLVYTIDKEHCIGCGQCKIVCGPGAIDYDMRPEEIEINVGSIVVAIGGDYYEPYDDPEYGYRLYPNVLTALEFERLLNNHLQTKGKLIRPSDGKVARKIAFIQCVGCRNKDKPYCSNSCGTYVTKEFIAILGNAVAVKKLEKALETYIFFNDISRFGDDFEESFISAIHEHDIRYIEWLPYEIRQKDGNLIVSYEDKKEKKIKHVEVDLVVLSTAPLPKENIERLAEKLGITLDEYGFMKVLEPPIGHIDVSKLGVYACGICSGLRDVPESVTQASSGASKAAYYVSKYEVEKEYPEEIDIRGQEPRVGVFMCSCGLNIGGYLDVGSVVEYAKMLPNVVYAELNSFTCSAGVIERIKTKIKEHNLNRIVVASCTPRTHEPLFRETCREAGLNPYLFEMANIREQCSWVHIDDFKKATEKAKDIVRIAITRARLLEPLYEKTVKVYPSSLVIGAGISGMTAALNIADFGFKVYLIEKNKEPGGLTKEIDSIFPNNKKASELLNIIIKKVKENKRIEVLTSTTVKDFVGYVGNFEVTLDKTGKEEKITVGTIIVATGAKPFEPKGMYGYGKYKNVITQLELERLIAENKLQEPKNIAMIQCVGAREKEGRTYCSRICCMVAIKNARQLKKQFPKANVYVIHRGIRLVGKREEENYLNSLNEGAKFIKYNLERVPEIIGNGDKALKINVYDQESNQEFMINTDIIILSTPLVPLEDNKKLSKMLRAPLNHSGFFSEAHAKLTPVDSVNEGIFLCGTAHSPRDIYDSFSEAAGAAARAIRLLSKGMLEVEATTSEVDAEKCIGCGVCVQLCPHGATRMENGRAKIIDVLCKGCGACVAGCPTHAIVLHQFKDEHYMAQLAEVFAE